MNESNGLSERELEILRLVATGASNKEIAQKLYISTNTVKVHLRNIFAKIGAFSRTEAAMYAVQMGVVPGNPPAEGSITEPDEGESTSARWRLLLPLGILIVVLLGVILLRQMLQPGRDLTESPVQAESTQWQKKASMPTARFGMATAVYEDQIYVIAGGTGENVTGAVEKYDPQTDTWEVLSPKPVAVSDVSAATIGGLIYLPGGTLQTGKPTDLMEIYDPNSDSWDTGEDLPLQISRYALVPFEGKIYLFGGWDGERYLNTILKYDPTVNQWMGIGKLRSARADAGAIAIGTKIYIFGGFDGAKALSDGEIFSPDATEGTVEGWNTGSPALVSRYGAGLAEIADTVYVMGGKGNIGEDQETVAYVHQSNEWRSIVAPPFELGAYSRLVSIGNFLYLIGGTLNGLPSDRLYSYQAVYTISVPLIIK
jgi:DNA-binding CsgD family transcriptional regulator/N-acetylneuraminic acid mutarotase